MVYMSSTDALAVLEARVHLPLYIPDTYVFVTAAIPDELIQRAEDRQAIPRDWNDNLGWSQSFGKAFADEAWCAALSVPSRIVPRGRNILLNPRHRDFPRILVNAPQRFEWDERLWGLVAKSSKLP